MPDSYPNNAGLIACLSYGRPCLRRRGNPRQCRELATFQSFMHGTGEIQARYRQDTGKIQARYRQTRLRQVCEVELELSHLKPQPECCDVVAVPFRRDRLIPIVGKSRIPSVRLGESPKPS